jgi:protein-S-isoprenylcysteine O-methyltransferase Ste14
MMSSLRRIGLFLETIVFTVLVPGTVVFWLPGAILDERKLAFPASWSVVQFAALLPLGVGTAIYLRCLWEFATRGRGIPAPIDHPKQLVVTGLYRYVRNPMYLGVLLFLFGESLFLQYWNLFVYALAWLVFVHLNVLLYEEPNLRRKFGPSYERYTAAVRRWVPGRKYASSECDVSPAVTRGLSNER